MITMLAAHRGTLWGYPLENRTYEQSSSTGSKYKFTTKERDKESASDDIGYDYFGSRYYDSRIANWTSIDPLFEKHFDFQLISRRYIPEISLYHIYFK